MIQSKSLTKKFDDFTALDSLNCHIQKGSIYGLVGSNGSGKSTFLRLVSGVYRPDSGEITVDGKSVYENPAIKQKIFFVSDEPYFLNQATMDEMAAFYKGLYPTFSDEIYRKLSQIFPIERKKKINTFSKGMKRQVMIILAFACNTEYILLDEAFDGLDPMMRQLLDKLLIEKSADSQLTVIISSHILRELEDICDHIGLLHQGRIIFEEDIDDLKLGITKVQVIFGQNGETPDLSGLQIIKKEQKGSLYSFVIKGKQPQIEEYLKNTHPVFMEALPLTLEEVFLTQMEELGYEFNNIL